ncbi:4-diphosphocytidyl-2-C-methyl-D-erythritol kinase [Corynebacterium pollutisoli]|uniref:4-diphosphocytidyl-2-C-methyl-D-erythritol kinase n=1 Tax=Corynebacterium pollutisoli TaxID=1610489 RepID=A0A1X7JWU9_9CORY|nr:4-(cytidine 5'-diphospho)-2-C-methyl-D-erythritol kinase [Corynebacterium pollutisoli]SMG32319.1 4-diphosphocytidyl-2-C-methyl-D-erythritol kinase [Corynebacterium pollutisoli]
MTRRMRTVTARGHAKVNLHLGVGALRPDGYHDLVSVFQSLNLSDTVTLELAPDTDRVSEGTIVSGLSVTGMDAASVPTDDTNLAWRAVDKLVDHYRGHHDLEEAQRVHISIHKGIPTAGGMAGGSADAAAALVAAHALLSERLPALTSATLLEMAADLGSDVPFTLQGGTMLGTGRGEQLTPMLSRGTYHWALVFFKEGLSTPVVFRELDDMREQGTAPGPRMETEVLSKALLSGNPREVAGALHNDLEVPARHLRPDVEAMRRAGLDAGALMGMVSGSGPTVAFLCESELHARDVLDDLLADGAYSGTVAHGPAKGAHLIS